MYYEYVLVAAPRHACALPRPTPAPAHARRNPSMHSQFMRKMHAHYASFGRIIRLSTNKKGVCLILRVSVPGMRACSHPTTCPGARKAQPIHEQPVHAHDARTYRECLPNNLFRHIEKGVYLFLRLFPPLKYASSNTVGTHFSVTIFT